MLGAGNKSASVVSIVLPSNALIPSGPPFKIALIRALEEGWIDAAGLDVLEKEPPDLENPLLHMDNVTITPHVASASARFDPRRKRRVGEEIALVLTGRWPMACVNPSVLERSDLTRWQPYSMERGPAR